MTLELMSQAGPGGLSFLDRVRELYKFKQWPLIEEVSLREIRDLPLRAFKQRARDIVAGFQISATMGISCFCEDGDLLSQWRGYGAAGYSIGFDSPELARRVETRYLRLCPVVYGPPASKHLMTNHSSVEQVLLEGGAAGNIATTLTLPLLGLASQVKDDAFKGEKEWRLGHVVASDDSELKFRFGAMGVTPYIDLKLCDGDDLLPIAEIRVAPGAESQLRKTAVQSLLRHHGYSTSGRDAVKIMDLRIPFRG